MLSKHIKHFSAKKAATTTTGRYRQVCFRLTLQRPYDILNKIGSRARLLNNNIRLIKMI